MREENNNKNEVTCIELPMRIGRWVKQPRNMAILASGDDPTPCPIRFENSTEHERRDSVRQSEPSPDPSNSDVHEQKEDVSRKMEHEDQFPITLEAGELIRVQLSNLGYLVDPNSGITIDSRHYKIGIHGISKLADGKKLNLFKTMSNEHFSQRNDGALGVTWFSRPLVRDDT
jgi:hypothetical protein